MTSIRMICLLFILFILLTVVKSFLHIRSSSRYHSARLSMASPEDESPKAKSRRFIRVSNTQKNAQTVPVVDSDELTLDDISGSSLGSLEDDEWTMEDLGSMGAMKGKGGIKPKKKQKQKTKTMSKTATIQSEFSRIVNVANLPAAGNALCKIVASAGECQALSARLGIPDLIAFACNVTVGFDDSGVGVLIEGDFSAQIGSGNDMLPSQVMTGDFVTSLIISGTDDHDLSDFDVDMDDYDAQVPMSGDVDIGEICTQYLAMETFQ